MFDQMTSTIVNNLPVSYFNFVLNEVITAFY